MAGRPKQPREKAEITGAAAKNPSRHRATPTVIGEMLGEPSEHLDKFAMAAWVQFKREVPWLKESHRALMEIACYFRGQMFEGKPLRATDLNSFQSILSKIGATPSDEGKIAAAVGWTTPPPSGDQSGEGSLNGNKHKHFDA